MNINDKNMISFTARLGYLIGVKKQYYVISHNYAKIKVDSCDSIPLEKRLRFYSCQSGLHKLHARLGPCTQTALRVQENSCTVLIPR